jgi:hypothetical protein
VQLFAINVFQYLNNGHAMENKWKLVQFSIVSILLNKSKPMISIIGLVGD